MTVCRGCAKKACAEASRKQPKPIMCVRCRKPLPESNGSIKPDKIERWMCPECKEAVISRETDACFVCGKPFTMRGFARLRAAQKDPHDRPAYRQFTQGRKVA